MSGWDWFIVVLILAGIAASSIWSRMSGSFNPDSFLRERYMHKMETDRLLKLAKQSDNTAILLGKMDAWQVTQVEVLKSMSNQQIEAMRVNQLLTSDQLNFMHNVLGLALTSREQAQLRRHESTEARLNRMHDMELLQMQADLAAGKEPTFEEMMEELKQTQELLKRATGSRNLDARTRNQSVNLLLERLRRRK